MVARNVYGVRTPGFEKLEAKLLAVGGQSMVALPDPHLQLVLERGRVFPTEGRKRIRGEPHRCHANTALEYLASHHLGYRDRCEIAVGYALGGGDWWQHAWGWDGRRILESIRGFEAYFGAVLEPAEAIRFVLSQLLPTLPGWAAVNERIARQRQPACA
jgi:hypothetical protein